VSTPRTLTLPDGVTRVDVATSRGSFAALTAGPVDAAAPVVVLVPGWTGSKEDFATLLPELAASGRRVVAFDQRGQFETPGDDNESSYAMGELAADLGAVCCAVSPVAVDLVGHSFGGLVAARAVIDDPSQVNSLVMLCSGPGALPADRHGDLHRLVQALSSSGPEATWQAMRERERLSGVTMPPAEVEAWLRQRFLQTHPVALAAKTRHLTSAEDCRTELRERPTPVLVMAGEHDDGWPVQVQADMAALIGATLVVLAGLGHSPAVEDPAATAEHLLRFWDSWTPGADDTWLTLTEASSEVTRARHLVRDRYERLLPPERLYQAELLTSELVTNALVHAQPPATLHAALRGGNLLVVVSDSGGGSVIEPRANHGRGLPIVAAFAQRFGAWTHADGTSAWFWLPVDHASEPELPSTTGDGSSAAQGRAGGPISIPAGHDSR